MDLPFGVPSMHHPAPALALSGRHAKGVTLARGIGAPPIIVADAIARLGLNRPILEQYRLFLQGALAGDPGRSFSFGEPALRLILGHMPATMELALASLLIGIPLGLCAGLRPDGLASRATRLGWSASRRPRSG